MVSASYLPVAPGGGRLQPVGIDHIRILGGFWGDRQQLNADKLIPHSLRWENRLDRELRPRRRGHHRGPPPGPRVRRLRRVQADRGHGLGGRSHGRRGTRHRDRAPRRAHRGRAGRGRLPQHPLRQSGAGAALLRLRLGPELYCYGHLIQAAVARIRTGREDAIVLVAIKAADHVCREFGQGAREDVWGHPGIEVALAELSRATGDARYLEQARIFLDRRGHGILPDIEFGRAYYQDDEPFRESTVLRGHSVRVLYLCAAAVDIAVEKGDAELLEIARRQFDATIARRTYITGGMGSHHQDEAFGVDLELPPDRSYCETCAGIGSVMVAWRLLLATGDLRYGNVIERALYNIVAASPSEAGDGFIYANTLHRRTPAMPADPDEALPRANASLRAPWFEVSCCPTNVARTFASLSTLVATASDDAVQIVQYAPVSIEAEVAGSPVRLTMATGYPYDGRVVVTVDEAEAPFALEMRIPGWAEGATVGGEAVVRGTCRIEGLTTDDVIELDLPLAPRLIRPDSGLDAVRGTVAVERGPFVLCVESVDLPGGLDVAEIEGDEEFDITLVP